MSILFVGDSKTATAENTWPADLVNALVTASGSAWVGTNVGIPTTTVAQWAASLNIIPSNARTSVVLVNLGANDVLAMPVEATWKANYLAILDDIHAKSPGAIVYVSRAWRQGYDTESDTLATWVADIVAARSFARLGDDERAWFKPNVATYSDDGVHYNAAGDTAAETVKQTAMGY